LARCAARHDIRAVGWIAPAEPYRPPTRPASIDAGTGNRLRDRTRW
jgi:hypothetical protein